MRASPLMPPLQALRVFEVVGRLLSFRRACEELSITQSAVSHHIRRLEETIGARLFERKARSVQLTTAGERYLQAVTRAFALITDGTAELTREAVRQRLRVSLLPSFAANWLVPRLGRFRDAHPGVDVDLEPTLRLIDLSRGEADLAIRYGHGPWPNTSGELILVEQLSPVVSPALVGQEPLWRAEQVLNHPLLLIKRTTEWDIWAEEAGVDLTAARTIQLTDYNIVIQAALDGLGVALGRRILIEDRIRSGALVAPYSTTVTSPRAGYWLLAPERRRLSHAARAFAEWIRAETRTSGGRQSLDVG